MNRQELQPTTSDLSQVYTTTPADLRARIARDKVHIFKLAAEVGIHPSNLGMMLNERRPLDPVVAQRVVEALDMLTNVCAVAVSR